jgi:glutamate racemase
VFDDGVAIVDSANTTAAAARELLHGLGIARGEGDGDLTLLATDGATRFARVGGQFLGRDLTWQDIEVVDL